MIRACWVRQAVIVEHDWEQFESVMRSQLPTSWRLADGSELKPRLEEELRTKLCFEATEVGGQLVTPPE